jgi:hypothetical protein
MSVVNFGCICTNMFVARYTFISIGEDDPVRRRSAEILRYVGAELWGKEERSGAGEASLLSDAL